MKDYPTPKVYFSRKIKIIPFKIMLVLITFFIVSFCLNLYFTIIGLFGFYFFNSLPTSINHKRLKIKLI